MIYLLDTHAVLWLLAGDPRIEPVRGALEHPRSTVLLSAVTHWEIAIKSAVGKLVAPPNLPEILDRFAFEPLPITAEHAWRVHELPSHHADPFDRLLIAQATLEHATIISADEQLDAYRVPRLW